MNPELLLKMMIEICVPLTIVLLYGLWRNHKTAHELRDIISQVKDRKQLLVNELTKIIELYQDMPFLVDSDKAFLSFVSGQIEQATIFELNAYLSLVLTILINGAMAYEPRGELKLETP